MNKLITGLIITAMFGAGLYLGLAKRGDDQLKILMQDSVVTVLQETRPVNGFRLQDHDGKSFDLARLRGKWSLLFFGFTNCPDICPTTLATLNQLYTHLEKKPAMLDDMQFVFISVDPGRDDAAKLKKYVKYFNKDFIGITGDKASLAMLAKPLGVYYEVLDKSGKKNYAVNHSAAIFIIDKDANFFGLMTPPLDAAAMAVRIELIKQL